MPVVSVVVPIYNVEDYLGECLESIRGQSYSDIEVLCVVDGSEDGSAEIAKRFAAQDSRFFVLEKENGGVSSARNYGIERALGDIIMFVDADDWLFPHACARVVEVFEDTGCDIVRFGARADSPQESARWYERVLSPQRASYEGFHSEVVLSESFSPFVWNVAVSRSLLVTKNVRFRENLSLGEDAVFVMSIYPRASKCEVIDDCLYLYRADRTGSSMRTIADDAEKRMDAHLRIVDAVLNDWRELGLLTAHQAGLFRWSQIYLVDACDRLPENLRAEYVSKINALWSDYFTEPGMAPAAVAMECLCRGSEKIYIKYRVTSLVPFEGLDCSASLSNGAEIPVTAYPCDSLGPKCCAQSWVVIVPQLDFPIAHIALRPDGRVCEQADLRLDNRWAKWLSRLNYRIRPDACREIRDYEQSFTYNNYQVEILQRFDADEQVVWRCVVRWAGDAERKPALRVKDGRGMPIESTCFFLEFQPADVKAGVNEHALFVSLRFSASCDSFIVEAYEDASDDGDAFATGFAAVSKACNRRKREETRDFMKSAGDDDEAYKQWFAEHRLKPGDAQKQRELGRSMSTSFDVMVVPDSTGEYSEEPTIASVTKQTYENWRLVASDAVGRLRSDYVAIVAAGDLLEPDALFACACSIERERARGRASDVLYCDEDVVDDDGALARPVFKSKNVNVDLQYCWNWTGTFLIIRRCFLESLQLAMPRSLDAWAYDFTLRAFEHNAAFTYVPRMLHHARRSPLDLPEASALRESLFAHFERTGVSADVVEEETPRALRVSYRIPEPHPLVSIIIPSKDQVEMLDACVRSIEEKSSYDALEIIVVENNSVEQKTFDYYERMSREYSNVRILTWPDEFNYSKIVNYGAHHARGSYLLFLNNDTEVIEPRFVEEMVGCLQRKDVGVVGAKLLFRDNLVQHSGMGVAVWNAVVHTNQNKTVDEGGYLNRACLPGNYASVTGACQMVRSEVFAEVGGYDEQFAVGFNDVDFCLRLQAAGYLVTYNPRALLHHYEFASRGRETADHDKLVRWKGEQALLMRRWPELFVEGDPYTSSNLVRNNTYYRL